MLNKTLIVLTGVFLLTVATPAAEEEGNVFPWGPGIEVEPAPGVKNPPAEPAPPPAAGEPGDNQPSDEPTVEPAGEAPGEENNQPATEAPDDATRAKELVKHGIAMLGKKRYDEALKAFIEAEKLDPALAQAPFGAGMAYIGLDKPDEAIEAFEKAKTLKPDEPNIYIRLGRLYTETGRVDKALEAYKKAVKLDPKLEEARDVLIDYYVETENWTAALEQLDEAIKNNKFVAKRYIQRGDIKLRLDDYKQAEKDYSKALELVPDAIEASIGLANVMIGTAQYEKALEVIEPIIQQLPRDPAIHLLKGKALYLAGKPAEGLSEIDAALRLGSKDPAIHLKAAQFLMEAGENEKAVEALKKTVALDPGNPKPHEMLAQVYDKMGRKEEALSERAEAKRLAGKP